MRRARLTYKNAWHHVMNRGYGGQKIFIDNEDKKYFIYLVKTFSKKLQIIIAAFCVMDNHYHLILQNKSGKMSDFMRELNGDYGFYFRQKYGGKGYVFQNRFRSTLIQEDGYLEQAIFYALMNPVRAKIVDNPFDYLWSSVHCYFSQSKNNSFLCFVDTSVVKKKIKRKNTLLVELQNFGKQKLETISTRSGLVFGNKSFKKKAMRLFDRRQTEQDGANVKRRKNETFLSVNQIRAIIQEQYSIKLSNLPFNSGWEKKIRRHFLVLLKVEGGLKYSDIILLPEFKKLKLSSLGTLYATGIQKIKNKKK